MPSIKKNLHKLMRNLSSPSVQISCNHSAVNNGTVNGDFAVENGRENGKDRARPHGVSLRRTVCSDAVQQYESRDGAQSHCRSAGAYSPSQSMDDDEESGSFIHRYLNGEIRRIHPKVVYDRTGENLPLHILAPLDEHLRVCVTGPDEGASQIPYLGSRRIYDKSSSDDFYSAFPPDTEEKIRHMPAMLRAAYFAKSGQQCYLPRQDFQNLIINVSQPVIRENGESAPAGGCPVSTISPASPTGLSAAGTNAQSNHFRLESLAVAGDDAAGSVRKGVKDHFSGAIPLILEPSVIADNSNSKAASTPSDKPHPTAIPNTNGNLNRLSITSGDSINPNLLKSVSCVSMTHIGTAPRARIDELLEEESADVIFEDSASSIDVSNAPATQKETALKKITEEEDCTLLIENDKIGLAGPGSDSAAVTRPSLPSAILDATISSATASNQDSGDEMLTDSFAEVVIPRNGSEDPLDNIPSDLVRKSEVPPVVVPSGGVANVGESPAVLSGSAKPGKPHNRGRHQDRSSRPKDRKRFRSLHHQLLEDVPFCLESRLPWIWKNHNEKAVIGCGDDRAYGTSTTLYERHPQTNEVAGNPIADVFAVCARENNAILAIADGVNWGDKARVAAQCAVRGAVDFLEAVLFQDKRKFRTTKELFMVLLDAMHAAHNLVLQEHGALATLCIAVVCPLQEARRYVACCCNVGDSFAYVYSRKFGVREITKGSHNVNSNRDMRDALGALGPVDGCVPELSNITCSMSLVEADDIVFLTTDGISDNFDPVIGKFCIIENDESVLKQITNNVVNGNVVGPTQKGHKGRFDEEDIRPPLSLPAVSAHQRHELTLLRMEDLIRHGITVGDKPCSNAKELCSCFINFAVQLTSAKRHILEDPDLYPAEKKDEKQSRAQQRHQRRKACERLALMPGKLDHATLVAYQVGEWTGTEDSPVVPPYSFTNGNFLNILKSPEDDHSRAVSSTSTYFDELHPCGDKENCNGDSRAKTPLTPSPSPGITMSPLLSQEVMNIIGSSSGTSNLPPIGKAARRISYHFRSIDSPETERRSLYLLSTGVPLVTESFSGAQSKDGQPDGASPGRVSRSVEAPLAVMEYLDGKSDGHPQNATEGQKRESRLKLLVNGFPGVPVEGEIFSDISGRVEYFDNL